MSIKGYGFSIIMVLVVLTLVEIVLLQRQITSHQMEKYFIRNRINEMRVFYENIIYDSEKSLEIIAKRAIPIAVSYVVGNGAPLENADLGIMELMVNGTLNGKEEPLMQTSTISDWVRNMTNIARLKGYYLSLSFENISVNPYDSFKLLIETDLKINITDQNGIASISRIEKIKKQVSIQGFEDPLYSLKTGGRVTHRIYKTSYNNLTNLLASGEGGNLWSRGLTFIVLGDPTPAINFPNKSKSILVIENPKIISVSVINQYLGVISGSEIDLATTIPYVKGVSLNSIPNNTYILVDGEKGNVWEIENFIDHVDKGYYYPSQEGPSFLDRLEGKLYIQPKYSSKSQNVIGIESFVNKTHLISRDLDPKLGQSNIDYLYFSDYLYSGKNVKGVHSYVIVDSSHAVYYEVEDILVS